VDGKEEDTAMQTQLAMPTMHRKMNSCVEVSDGGARRRIPNPWVLR
jgi:hypothetical protein